MTSSLLFSFNAETTMTIEEIRDRLLERIGGIENEKKKLINWRGKGKGKHSHKLKNSFDNGDSELDSSVKELVLRKIYEICQLIEEKENSLTKKKEEFNRYF